MGLRDSRPSQVKNLKIDQKTVGFAYGAALNNQIVYTLVRQVTINHIRELHIEISLIC